MTEQDLILGSTVQDLVTKFQGVATGVCRYISGCVQVAVIPPVGADGKLPESQWFDIQRLVLVGNEFITLDNTLTPGFDSPPPKRA